MVDKTLLFIPGVPASKGSYRILHSKSGGGFLIPADKREKAWRQQIVEYVKKTGTRPYPPQTPVNVTLTFHLPRPKTVHRTYPSVKPDLDKLIRCVLDAITDSGLWADDGCVVELNARKIYDTNIGVDILISKPEERKNEHEIQTSKTQHETR